MEHYGNDARATFAKEFAVSGNAAAAGRIVGVPRRTAARWGEELRGQGTGVREPMPVLAKPAKPSLYIPEDRRTLTSDVKDGHVIVFSDAHYWPGEITVAHRALVALCKKLRPVMTVANGDIFDGARAGRHPRIGWEKQPTMKEELEVCQERMNEIVAASPGATRVWNWGNHDIRYDSYASGNAGELEGIHGMSLADHFPSWQFGWSLWLNDEVVIKHRHKGGIHAAYNNTKDSGMTMLTGHTHILEVKPYCDYRGRRWGVQTGTITRRAGPQFVYQEDSPSHQNGGFVVLTFRDGVLMTPELCEVVDDIPIFRGAEVAI